MSVSPLKAAIDTDHQATCESAYIGHNKLNSTTQGSSQKYFTDWYNISLRGLHLQPKFNFNLTAIYARCFGIPHVKMIIFNQLQAAVNTLFLFPRLENALMLHFSQFR